MDPDLNEKPTDRIEEQMQMKRLEAIFKAMKSQNLQKSHTPIQITNFEGELLTKAENFQDENKVIKEEVGVNVEEETSECEKTGKRKAEYLVAEALGMDTSEDGIGGRTRHFFDCNICFEKANEPVLTCCGHLFCWECFYNLSYAYSNAKECPVCEGEVVETDIIPVYGNGRVHDNGHLEMNETGSQVPDRPRAARVESTRQRRRRRRAGSSNHDLSLFGDFDGLEESDSLQFPSLSPD
ncbi:uncharacterized protein [Cicer arietinum]|uniref:E3 ubiquitin-protein ligase RMA n=1 Tax=Cicer arietinum TaxID=3827 RepID=A0A1S2XF79_CICAR|nr:E3 ubiquitin-protein ligase brl2-like [Cicer arietinum]